MLVNDIQDMIGHTPLVELKKIKKKYHLKGQIFVKLEGFNLGGSSKSRIALQILKQAIKENKIHKNTKIIEVTSGNTGIAFSMLCAQMNLSFIAIMPENMSKERITMMKAYGGKVLLTPKEEGMEGALKKLEELKKQMKDYFIPSQFYNEENIKAHYIGTGVEIIEDLPSLDVFVAGIGTGGTISGVSKRLKEYKKEIKVIGVEPSESPLITKGKAGKHEIQGIGPNFISPILDLSNVDDVLRVSSKSAKKRMKELARLEGILVGISSGAVMEALIKITKKRKVKAVGLLPDFGERYLSILEKEYE